MKGCQKIAPPLLTAYILILHNLNGNEEKDELNGPPFVIFIFTNPAGRTGRPSRTVFLNRRYWFRYRNF